MLTLEAPFYQINDVIVFRDHAVKTQFYYLAGLPKLSVDANKKVQFAMLKYKNALDAGGPAIRNRDALGGAFLMLGVDCGVDADSLKSELASQIDVDGDITLTPVLYTNGTAQIVALDYQAPPPTPPSPTPAPPATPPPVSHFVKAVVGSTTPSLLSDQRAIFSLSLDTDAATLIEAAYENDMSPIGVIYRLEFSGLRPAISVQAEVDYKRVYDQLKIDFQLGVHTDDTSASVKNAPADSTGTTGTGMQSGQSDAGSAASQASQPMGVAVQQNLQQPIQIRIEKGGGSLGAVSFKYNVGPEPVSDTKGTVMKTTAPAGGQTTFRWNAPSTPPVQIDFPAGNYVEGETFTVTPARTVTRTGVGSAKPASPLISVVAPPPAPLPPPQVNKTQGAHSPGGGSQTPPGGQQATKSTASEAQVAVDVNIDYTMAKLVQTGAIKITIVREEEGKSVDDMQKEAMDLIRDDVLKKFFTPQLTSTPAQAPIGGGALPPARSPQPATLQQPATQRNLNPGSTTGSGSTQVQVGFQLRDVHEEELDTVTFDYTVQAPVTQIHAPNGFFSTLLSKTSKADLIKEVNLDDEFFKALQVTASTIADFSTTDLKSVVLALAYGGTVDEPGTVLSPTFTPADTAPKTFQAFVENGEMAYRYRTSYYFGQDVLVGSQTTEYHTDWRTTLSRALVVNPPIDVPMLHVYVAPGLIDWDLIAQVETTVSYDDPVDTFHAERTFVINPSFQSGDWIVRLTDPTLTTYNVQNTWILKDNDRRITGPVQTASAAQLFVFDPFVDRMPVIIQPEVDPATVTRATIAFHYQDPANQLDVRKLVELTPPYRTTTVSLPLMDSKKRSYSYQATLYRSDGSAENRPEMTTDGLSIILASGSLPFDVTVMLVGDLAQAGLAALQVDLRAEPMDGQTATVQSHLFQAGGDTKWAQRLTLRTDRPDHKYQVQTTAFYATKDPVQSDWDDHDTSILVIQPSRLEP